MNGRCMIETLVSLSSVAQSGESNSYVLVRAIQKLNLYRRQVFYLDRPIMPPYITILGGCISTTVAECPYLQPG